MEKTVFKRPNKIKSQLTFLFLLIIFFAVILFIPRSGVFDQTGFLSLMIFEIVFLFFLAHLIFLYYWERLIIDNGFFDIRYSKFFWPGYKHLPILKIQEVVFIFAGQADGKNNLNKEQSKFLKTKIADKINNLFVQKKVCGSASYSDGSFNIRVGVAKVLFKTVSENIPVRFFSSEDLIKVVQLLPENTKLSWHFGQIRLNYSLPPTP